MKTDWKDDIFERRRFRMENNGDGTVTPIDVTSYSQQGDLFGAKELNEIGTEVNTLSKEVAAAKKSVSDGKAEIAAAITLKRVATAATDTFAKMAENIKKIVLGSGNAQPADVMAGKTATNDSGVEFAGTMPRIASVDPAKSVVKSGTALYARMSYGAHVDNASSGYPEVSIPQVSAAAAAGVNGDYMLDSYNLLGVQGKIQSMAGQTVTPTTVQQTVNCAWKRMTGNVVVPGFSMPPANVVKKGYALNIYGQKVMGTFEGYVAGPGDIYKEGDVNSSYPINLWNCPPYEDDDGNHYQAVTAFRTNTIFIKSSYNSHWSNSIFTANPIELTPINNIHISIRTADGGDRNKTTDVVFGVYETPMGFADRPVKGYSGRFTGHSTYQEITVNLNSINRPLYIGFWVSCDTFVSWEVNHIWFD